MVEQCLFITLELAEMETCFFQNGGLIEKLKNIHHHNMSTVPNICHLPAPPYFSLVTTFNESHFDKKSKYINHTVLYTAINFVPNEEISMYVFVYSIRFLHILY
jgi:hypothetical protein